MTKGFLYVVFGSEYLKPFKTSITYLKKISKLPIAVVTNLTDITHDELPQVDHIIFCDVNTDRNREIRTQAIKYTPFDQTLMMDADSIPISPKINGFFSQLDNHDFGFQKSREFTNSISKIYAHALYKTKTTTPLTAYSGGIIFFNKSPKCENLFNLWHEYWKLTGEGRDMPSLACAIKNSPDITFFTVENCIDREITSNTIIFHAYGEHDKSIIPKFEKNKPFDNRNDLFLMININPNEFILDDPLN